MIGVIILKKLFNYLPYLKGIPKTIYFNYKYFGLKGIFKLKILVSNNVKLNKLKGRIRVNDNLKMGAIRIGFGEVDIFDKSRSKSIFNLKDEGYINFKGKANIGQGTKFSVNGILEVGENFTISAESEIICYKYIEIGDNVLISWKSLIMDTDFHSIYDFNHNQINSPKDIKIGHNVWIGARTTILKGASIPQSSIIAASTTVTKKYNNPNVIIAGNPSRIIKKDIYWKV